MTWEEIVAAPMSDGERRLQRATLRADEASIRSIRAKDPQAAYDYDVRQWCRDALTNPLARYMPC